MKSGGKSAFQGFSFRTALIYFTQTWKFAQWIFRPEATNPWAYELIPYIFQGVKLYFKTFVCNLPPETCMVWARRPLKIIPVKVAFQRYIWFYIIFSCSTVRNDFAKICYPLICCFSLILVLKLHITWIFSGTYSNFHICDLFW